MDPVLKDRILRHLETLPDERALQVLDYIEFLESRYAARSTPDNILARLTDTVQDTMRAGKLPLTALSGTVSLLDGASRMMRGVAAAAQAVVDEAATTARSLGSTEADTSAPPAASGTPPADPGPGTGASTAG